MPPPPPSPLSKALSASLSGGLPGAFSMVINVLALMWMRTTINHQMRTGMTSREAFKHLYNEGGIPRFYAGLWAALLQGPLSRFGDTAANEGVKALLADSTLPMGVQTVAASAAAALWRVVIMPVDTLKTNLQVHGSGGIEVLKERVRTEGVQTLFTGAPAAMLATFAGHYPWFATNNLLEASIPEAQTKLYKQLRRVLIGFLCSVVSDCVSNSIRVLKTYTQTDPRNIGYVDAAKEIIAKDGVTGLLGRGLAVKIMCNGIQGVAFSLVWKNLMDRAKEQNMAKAKAA